MQGVGKIVEFGRANVRVPDQQCAIVFYISGLGLTRDHCLRTGTDNVWIHAGTCQFHLPIGPAQVLRFADFSGIHLRLLERGLITQESNASQYLFQDKLHKHVQRRIHPPCRTAYSSSCATEAL